MNARWLLTVLILAGLVLGVVVGQLLFDDAYNVGAPIAEHTHAGALRVFDFLGFTVFMGLLKMLIIPLIASSVIVGVTSVGDFSKLGRIGIRTLMYYFATMAMAVVIGLLLVTALAPGDRIGEVGRQQALAEYTMNETVAASAEGGLIGIVQNLVSLMIPTNIVQAMADGKPLSVITFSIFFGVVVTLVGKRGKPITDFFNAVFEVLMKMVHAVIWLAPVGVFALMAWSVARIGLGVFSESIGKFMLVVLTGLGIHGLIVLPLILWVFGRTRPFRFLYQMRQAMMTALATDSSSATLPVTIECATEFGGVSKRSAGFVLPLGSTINMDGTALYEAVAVVFMAQAFNVDLSLTQLIVVAVTATLAAVGAAGIPSAGLVTMVIVVDAVNDSLGAPAGGGIPLAGIGLIIGVDRLLDMVRTMVNVWGDAVGAKIIDRMENQAAPKLEG